MLLLKEPPHGEIKSQYQIIMKKFYNLMASCLAFAASSISAYAEEPVQQIAFMGENVEINGTALGWDATLPVVVEVNPETGKFEFTARFTRTGSLWQMYTDGIGGDNWTIIKQSIYTPNIYTAFVDMDPEPEDIVVTDGGAERFNLKYLPEAVGKTVPVYLDPDGGFWVGGGSDMTANKQYRLEISGDLSEMTVVSVETVEIKVDYPENLYIYGDATPGGWDSATPMTNMGDGIYQYAGILLAGSPGALQIYADDPTVCGTGNMAYGPAEVQNINSWGLTGRLNFYETDRPANCYYKVQDGETNNYLVTVDLVNNSISIQLDNLYFVGVPTDWSFAQMENEGNRIFSYKGHFAPNSAFCFTATQTWATKIATDHDAKFGLAGYTDNSLSYGSNFSMSNIYEGYYIVRVDLNNNILTTRTYNPDPVEKLYVCNDGTYKEMTDGGDGTYYWVGIIDGDFTITPKAEAYPCYMPGEETVAVPDAGLSEGEMLLNITAANNVNNKWTIGTAGQYTIKVNPSAMTVTVEKGDTSGIDSVISDNDDNAPVHFYDLMGRKVENPSKGLYIRVQGGTARKVIIQ